MSDDDWKSFDHRTLRGGGSLVLAAVLLLSGCFMAPGAPPAPVGMERPAPPDDRTAVAVRVDSVRRLVVMEAGPFDVPPAPSSELLPGGHAAHDETSPLLRFEWPVEGWYRGFRVRLIDESGRPASSEILHHVIGVNFDRKQLVYPVPERIFGVGTETTDILLPERFGIPLEKGSSLGVYASWQNDTGRTVEDVYVQVALAYTPADSGAEPEEVVPIYLDTHNVIGGTNAFDLPPGHVTESYEFDLPVDGALLGLGGHLHDYGRSVRLEDAESGEVLVKLHGIADENGRLHRVEQRIFRRFFGLLDDRVPLEGGRRYRVVGEYFNPTDETIEMGGMAHLSGIFAPESMEGWVEVDRDSPAYRQDLSGLPPTLGAERSDAPVAHEHDH